MENAHPGLQYPVKVHAAPRRGDATVSRIVHSTHVKDKDLEWRWLDFERNPYMCCPKPKKYIGGNPICPKGWTHQAVDKCCVRQWEWQCQDRCAQHECSENGAEWSLLPSTDRSSFKCCLGYHRNAVAKPHTASVELHKDEMAPIQVDLMTQGMVWSTNQTIAMIVLCVVGVFCCIRRYRDRAQRMKSH